MSNHDEHKAEGKGQTYTKGWWAGVIGVLIIALGFVTIGCIAFSNSGTERWGITDEKSEGKETMMHEGHQTEPAATNHESGFVKDTLATKAEEEHAKGH